MFEGNFKSHYYPGASRDLIEACTDPASWWKPSIIIPAQVGTSLKPVRLAFFGQHFDYYPGASRDLIETAYGTKTKTRNQIIIPAQVGTSLKHQRPTAMGSTGIIIPAQVGTSLKRQRVALLAAEHHYYPGASRDLIEAPTTAAPVSFRRRLLSRRKSGPH